MNHRDYRAEGGGGNYPIDPNSPSGKALAKATTRRGVLMLKTVFDANELLLTGDKVKNLCIKERKGVYLLEFFASDEHFQKTWNTVPHREVKLPKALYKLVA